MERKEMGWRKHGVGGKDGGVEIRNYIMKEE